MSKLVHAPRPIPGAHLLIRFSTVWLLPFTVLKLFQVQTCSVSKSAQQPATKTECMCVKGRNLSGTEGVPWNVVGWWDPFATQLLA